ncbi:hypothetical protein [Pectinatus sottacetonis]|uniref:hypothetical protein n=1 Tax=Pectinatus sottacetonis TaxID=1002795 RepID=UPI0018C4CEFB|nr:hypothetical protein [Pectinatus sottacetonis]
MKKIFFVFAAIFLIGASTAMAAPINTLANNETAVGIGTRESYIEHKFSPKLTIGYQYLDRDEYNHQNDIYAQYDLFGSNLKAIAGFRNNLPGDNSNGYGGIAVVTPNMIGPQAYASYVKGSDFDETQVGINMNVIANISLNVNYHNFDPDHGHSENGVGVGATVKF